MTAGMLQMKTGAPAGQMGDGLSFIKKGRENMPKNDHVKSIRLYESVKNNIGEEAANSIAQTVYLSKSADFKRKFKWANAVCSYLEDHFTGELIRKIRMGCACTPSSKYTNDVRNLYVSSDSLDKFCNRYNTVYAGKHSVWHEENVLFFSYPTCLCDCVQRINESVSETWCLCTLGYTKNLFDSVLGCNTQVELIESVKTGGRRCVMKITGKESDAHC